MISKSKLGVKLGAIAFIAAVGFAAPALAANYGGSNLAPSQSGGGSYGYNNKLSTDYRLTKHHVKHHLPSKQQ
jgi:hypothetical protein